MGGWGSGRHGWHSTTGDFLNFDIRGLSRGGWLNPGAEFTSKWLIRGEVRSWIQGCSDGDRITLTYRCRSKGEQEWESFEYPIFLERTRCHFGGTRPWFICPRLGCGRRVAVLYAGRHFLCRLCHQLAYASQRESPLDRALSRAQALHFRMGGDGSVIDGEPFKRKGMHQKTYDRLMRRYRRFDLSLKLEEVRRFGHIIG